MGGIPWGPTPLCCIASRTLPYLQPALGLFWGRGSEMPVWNSSMHNLTCRGVRPLGDRSYWELMEKCFLLSSWGGESSQTFWWGLRGVISPNAVGSNNILELAFSSSLSLFPLVPHSCSQINYMYEALVSGSAFRRTQAQTSSEQNTQTFPPSRSIHSAQRQEISKANRHRAAP